MQVSFQATALGVARFDDAEPRCGELISRVGARDRQPDQLRERLKTALGLGRQRLTLPQSDPDDAPDRAADDDRDSQSRVVAELTDFLRKLAGEALELFDAGRSSGVQHRPRRETLLDRQPASDLDAPGHLLPKTADDRAAPVVVETLEDGLADPEQATDFLRHQLEDLLGWRVACYEGRHTPERRLLLDEPAQARVRPALLGEVANDRHDLISAAGNDPRLSPVPSAVDRELVLDHLHFSAVERTLDPDEDGVGKFLRQEIANCAAEELIGGEQVGRACIRPNVEIRAVAPVTDDGVGDCVQEGTSSQLSEARVLESLLVREREAGCGVDGVEQLRA